MTQLDPRTVTYAERVIRATYYLRRLDVKDPRETHRIRVHPETWDEMLRENVLYSQYPTAVLEPVIAPSEQGPTYFGFGVDFDDELEVGQVIVRQEVVA